MKARILQSIVVLILSGLMMQSALAQGGPNSDRIEKLRRELERTAELIQRAREVVAASDNPVAAQTLASAIELQNEAQKAFGAGSYLLSDRLTRKAREQATKALAAARISEQLEGVVLRKLERARELQDNARELLGDQQNDNFSAVFESTQNNLLRAWEFYRNRNYRPAARLAEQVTRASQRMIVLFRDQIQSGSTFERRAETVERLIDYAREILVDCDSQAGKQMLQQAEQAWTMAHDLASRKQPGPALKALLRAKQAAQKAVDGCRRWDNLEQRYERMKAEIDRLTEAFQEGRVAGERAEAAELLLEQANSQLELAREGIREQQLKRAQAALQAAHLALKQAQKYMGLGY